MWRLIKFVSIAAVFLALNATAYGSMLNEMASQESDRIRDNVSTDSGVEIPIPLQDPAIADHDIGNVAFTVSNFGQYGLALTALNDIWDGEGFRMPQNGANLLFEGALLIGDGPTRVSNGARDEDQNLGDDFVADSDIDLFEPGPFADQEYHTSYTDGNALNPLDILVAQESYAFSSDPDDDYIITEYTITNTGRVTLEGVLVAHWEDWDMPWDVALDKVNFDRSRNLGYQFNGDDYRGQQVLSDMGIFSFMALENAIHVYPPYFTLEDKWSYMNAGIVDTAITVSTDCSIMITTGPYDIAPGESVVATFAIIGGNGLEELQANADAAIDVYGGPSEPAIADHDIGNVAFTVSNFGQYGLALTALNDIWDGEGFRMPQNGANLLFEGALLIGDGPTRVSNGARDEDQNLGDDFVADSDIELFEPGPFADQEYHTSYTDENALNPLDILVAQESYAFSSDPDDDYIITEYTITNTGSETLEGVLVAHWEDWDMPWDVALDKVNFDRSRNLGYQFNGDDYRGQQVLSDMGIFSFMALENAIHVYPPYFTLEDKWSYMNAGIVDTAITVSTDCSIMITTGPYDIAPGASVVAAFGIVGGNGLADLQANASAALERYGGETSVDDSDINQPKEFKLSQNYPNPFNATTILDFSIVQPGHVKLDIYNLLGQHIVTLVDDHYEAGVYNVTWDAGDLPSGAYFARLETEDHTANVKMMLLK